jgi:hypothetical protein
MSINAAMTMPVVSSEPSFIPVAMSMARLHARTHSNWHTTSSSPIAVFVKACRRAPFEFCQSHKTSLFIGMFLLFSLTFQRCLKHWYTVVLTHTVHCKNTKKTFIATCVAVKMWRKELINHDICLFLTNYSYIYTIENNLL